MSKFLENSIKDIINKHSTLFLAKKNVIGIELAYKVIKGITTKEPVLNIMVEKNFFIKKFI